MAERSRIPAAWLGAAIALLVVLGFAALDDYGVTWDEGLGDLFFGQRYLSYFTSFDSKFLDFDADPYPAGHSPDLTMSPFRVRPWEYYPVANVLAAATATVLSGWLGVLDWFDGFHALNLWLGAILLWVLVRCGEREIGVEAAVVSVLLLLTAPRLISHALTNTKDFPELVFFSLTLLAFHAAWTRGRALGVIGAGAISGLALGTKANALFLLPILLAVIALGLPRSWSGRSRAALLALSGGVVAGAGVFWASWPYLWQAPWERIGRHLVYVKGQISQVRPESVLEPHTALLGTTPLPFLILISIGVVDLISRLRRRDRFAVLLAAWIAVVLGRLYLPGAVNFDGVRHFLEVFPALALVAGLGAARCLIWTRGLATKMSARRTSAPFSRLVVATLILAAVAPGAWATVRSHPHQIAYWNRLVGGVRGAHQRALPQAGDYWGLSYRQGLRWLAEAAPQGAVLAVPVAEHTVRVVAQARLRADIGLAHVSQPTRPEIPREIVERLQALARERPVYVMFVPRADWSNQLMADCLNRLEPERVWAYDGVPILLLYRYAAPEVGGV